MNYIKTLQDFENAIGNSIDICIIEVLGDGFYSKVIQMISYLDFDNYGMVELEPPGCYISDFYKCQELYKNIFDYADDFSSYQVPLYYEEFSDPIDAMMKNCSEEFGIKKSEIKMVTLKHSDISMLVKLEPGFYLVGFENDEEVSQSSGND